MATLAIGESFENKKKQQQQQIVENSVLSHCSYYDHDYDPKSGFCSGTGTYRSVFKLISPQHDPNLDIASFVLSKLPPQHISETKMALIDSTTGCSVTYSLLKHSAVSLAASLHHGLGLGKGDVVLLLLSPNSIHYPTICLGILASGAIITPANPLSTPFEIAEQVRSSGAKLAVSAPEELHKLETSIPVLTTERSHDKDTTSLWPLLSVEELIEGGDESLKVPTRIDASRSDVAALLYCSGDLLKLTHGDLISMSVLVQWAAEKEKERDWNDILLCVQPMSTSHAYNYSAFYVLGLLCTGSTTAVASGQLDFRRLMKAMEKYHISNINSLTGSSGDLLSAMNKNGGGFDLSQLRNVSSTMGGSSAQRTAGKEFRRRFPWVALREGYGVGIIGVVCGPTTVFASEQEARRRTGSAGQLLPGIEGKVVDIKNGRSGGPGSTGELWLKGPTIMINRGASEQEGWLRTGDLAFFDEDGYLYIIDAIKDIINDNGNKRTQQDHPSIPAKL